MATLPINELDAVVSKVALPEHDVDVGALGIVVGVHEDGETLDVEFANAAGTVARRVRLPRSQVGRSTHEDA